MESKSLLIFMPYVDLNGRLLAAMTLPDNNPLAIITHFPQFANPAFGPVGWTFGRDLQAHGKSRWSLPHAGNVAVLFI
jgi:hypothetical protein